MSLDNSQDMTKFITFMTKLFRLETLLKFLANINHAALSSIVLINLTRSEIRHIAKTLHKYKYFFIYIASQPPY